MSNTETNFWLADPSYLSNIKKFIPTKNLSMNKKLNLVTLLLIILTVILLVFVKNKAYALIPIIGIILVVVYYVMNQKPHAIDTYEDKITAKKIRRTNKSNKYKTIKSPAYDKSNKSPKLLSNRSDTESFDSDFYTGQSPTDSTSNKLAEWLYKSPTPTCKEDSKYCLRLSHEDLRGSRFNPELS